MRLTYSTELNRRLLLLPAADVIDTFIVYNLHSRQKKCLWVSETRGSPGRAVRQLAGFTVYSTDGEGENVSFDMMISKHTADQYKYIWCHAACGSFCEDLVTKTVCYSKSVCNRQLKPYILNVHYKKYWRLKEGKVLVFKSSVYVWMN